MLWAEFPILLEEIERTLTTVCPGCVRDGIPGAVRVLARHLDRACEASTQAWRAAQPAGESG